MNEKIKFTPLHENRIIGIKTVICPIHGKNVANINVYDKYIICMECFSLKMLELGIPNCEIVYEKIEDDKNVRD